MKRGWFSPYLRRWGAIFIGSGLAAFGAAPAAEPAGAALSPEQVREIAAELLELDLRGLRLPVIPECLTTGKFKWIRPHHEPAAEGEAPEVRWLEEGARVAIERVVRREAGRVEVAYAIFPAGAGATIRGRFSLLLETSPRRQREQGHAAFLTFPDPWCVWRKCGGPAGRAGGGRP